MDKLLHPMFHNGYDYLSILKGPHHMIGRIDLNIAWQQKNKNPIVSKILFRW